MINDNLIATTNNRSILLRSSYLSFLGGIFLIAFFSYYVQYPGLLSSSGITPAGRVLMSNFPWIHDTVIQNNWIDSDSLCECMALIGILLSSVFASGLLHNGGILLCMTFIYSFLVTSGQVFYSFQWDILLLETGFVTAICCAPWRSFHVMAGLDDTIGAWPVRFLLFKLMFMSGVVKIQANCPTWKNLTALEYHFATQCLPTPLAWHAHQLHPLFLRVSVAATFIIEIPAAFLLIAPTLALRRLGAYLQIILMIVIMLTGNYNFFNMLTVALCLPCLEEDGGLIGQKISNALAQKKIAELFFSGWMQNLCGLGFLFWSTQRMFNVGGEAVLGLALDKAGCDDMINRTVPISILSTMIFTAWSILLELRRHRHAWRMTLCTMFKGLICMVYILITAIPLILQLTPQLHKDWYVSLPFVSALWKSIQPIRISSGYGLFRRMTGVGQPPAIARRKRGWGWAGLPPSVVARPEIIVEGIFKNTTVDEDTALPQDQHRWRELNFRWKPGKLTGRPRQVAPHQPRLDWQMWFAALGTYQHNPWFVHLLDKLLDGCGPVIDLLDEPRLSRGEESLSVIRARLWDYDLTRFDTKWSRRIPGATLVTKDPKNGYATKVGDLPNESSMAKSPSFWMNMLQWPGQYWARQNPRDYFPAIVPDNPQVSAFLSAYGYIETKREGGYEKVCVIENFRCEQFPLKSSRYYFCSGMEAIRRRYRLLMLVEACFLFFGMTLSKLVRDIIRSKTKEKSSFKPKLD